MPASLEADQHYMVFLQIGKRRRMHVPIFDPLFNTSWLNQRIGDCANWKVETNCHHVGELKSPRNYQDGGRNGNY